MSKKKKVLITDRFASDSLVWLQQKENLEVVKLDQPMHLPPEHLLGAHALLIRSRTPINEKLLQQARNLQVIITATSGFDHIDLAACQKWGITVMHTPTANIESAAQLTWGLVLNCANRIQEARPMMKSGHWHRERLIGMELSGRTYGIVGLGRIGMRVAQHAKCFGMHVVAYDPYADERNFEETGVQRLSYDELLFTSDVISYHVPKTLETDRMLNRANMIRLVEGMILINTSRGSVVDEGDLLWAMEKGWIRAAGLDVFEKEPLDQNSALIKHPQIVMTPHVGANTDEAFFKASQVAAEKLVAFFLAGSTSDTLPPRVPWYGATPLKAE